jgi:hypothetical protein
MSRCTPFSYNRGVDLTSLEESAFDVLLNWITPSLVDDSTPAWFMSDSDTSNSYRTGSRSLTTTESISSLDSAKTVSDSRASVSVGSDGSVTLPPSPANLQRQREQVLAETERSLRNAALVLSNRVVPEENEYI